MTVPTAYLTSTKNTAKVFEAIQKAGVPQAFTYEFLKQIGFASSSDRPIIPVMKAIGFLDESGRPTETYRHYKDPSSSKRVMAASLRRGYSDLYAVDTEAHSKSSQQLAGMFGRLSDKGESVTQKMASTFKALATLADFEADPPASGLADDQIAPRDAASEGDAPVPGAVPAFGGSLSLRHDVHVHLPLSTDVAVYDAIFKSLKANLL
ncbi:DUF5343 domain-containing protein [Microbacterium sp. K27]|uniref:DUF5343 domain-containing protein n=1 Tax=Microbacterium sp. K27 TaxID=2305445 RepID=UPI00109B7770|nr:DUF5343 domain-containing protein [Microbacterium sp. K27]